MPATIQAEKSPAPAAPTDPAMEVMRREKYSVARASVFAALVITVGKLVVGITSGSLGILSEAASSGFDLVMTVMTLLSVRVSDKPADLDHQYGHGKFENLSAFIETAFLLLACAWIVWEAIGRLFLREVHVEPSVAAFAVLFVSMVIDWWRSRALLRVARKYNSEALDADALHFRTDIWQVGVVMVGLALVGLADRLEMPWLRKADPIAALVVAGLILFVSGRLARRTLDALLDAAPPGARNRILDEVAQVEGVLEVDRVRIRRAGNRYFADLSVGMARNVTFQRSEQLVDEVTAAVERVLPDADVVVRSIPRPAGGENIFDRVRAVAARHNLHVHDVSVEDLRGRLHVELHLELDEKLSLRQAHDLVTQLEAEVRDEVPEISSILTHIESEPATIEPGDEASYPEMEARLRRIAHEFPEILDMHEIVVKNVRGKTHVTCHCTLPDELPLDRMHEVITALEIRFKQEAPELFKVLIHPEPSTDNRR
ncbi:MAG TPA: cation diffusion facilitator family transporter [Terriglobales bacterium]|nr:cation diffusion facilitator family transporter [Terriglobales bacterium]